MKTLKIYVSIFALCLIVNKNVSQPWQCAITETSNTIPMQLNNITQSVVVFYLDFPDGRINGQPPENDNELNQVQNLDAVCFMGYTAQENGGVVTWTKKCKKYTYLNCWDRIFSVNSFIGSAHPDWLSHGQYGMPYASGSNPPTNIIPGDTAKGYGSVKDYFNEISYGRFEIEPKEIRPLENDYRYRTGIGNNITEEDEFGNRYIIPIMLNDNKTSTRYNNGNNLDNMLTDAPGRVTVETGFNFEAHFSVGGRVIFIFAGCNNNNIGGLQVDQKIIVREKLSINTQNGGWRNVIEGISVECHEYGHTFGWMHTVLGAYDIMSTGTDMQNCPPWYDPEKVDKNLREIV